MDPIFRDFGGHLRFKGPAATVKCFENNPLVRQVIWHVQRPAPVPAAVGMFNFRSKSELTAVSRRWKKRAKVASWWLMEVAHTAVLFLETTLPKWPMRTAGVYVPSTLTSLEQTTLFCGTNYAANDMH